MEIIFRYKAELKDQPTDEEMENYIDKAIKEAISRNILTDYLTRKGTEVRNMFIGEYDYDLDIKVKSEEAREEGHAEGIAEGQKQKAIENAIMLVKKYNATPETAAQDAGAPLDKVLEALKL